MEYGQVIVQYMIPYIVIHSQLMIFIRIKLLLFILIKTTTSLSQIEDGEGTSTCISVGDDNFKVKPQNVHILTIHFHSRGKHI